MLALLGRREMSDLSPQSGQKRTLITSLSPIAIFPALEDQLAEPGAVELGPGGGAEARAVKHGAAPPGGGERGQVSFEPT
jgi:hypothetical protein